MRNGPLRVAKLLDFPPFLFPAYNSINSLFSQLLSLSTMTKKKKHRQQTLADKIRNRKNYLIKVLEEQGLYQKEMAMQVEIAARLYIKIRELEDTMSSAEYAPILNWESREGAVRKSINPVEELYSDYLSRYQQALKALGMNTDSKERKTQKNDGLSDFLDKFNE